MEQREILHGSSQWIKAGEGTEVFLHFFFNKAEQGALTVQCTSCFYSWELNKCFQQILCYLLCYQPLLAWKHMTTCTVQLSRESKCSQCMCFLWKISIILITDTAEKCAKVSYQVPHLQMFNALVMHQRYPVVWTHKCRNTVLKLWSVAWQPSRLYSTTITLTYDSLLINMLCELDMTHIVKMLIWH